MTTNQTIDGVLVSRELLERIREKLSQTDYTWPARDPEEELRALLDADKVNNRQMGLMQYVEAHPVKPVAQPQGEPVAWCIDREEPGHLGGYCSAAMKVNGVGFQGHTKPLYAEQPVPVAMVMPDPVKVLHRFEDDPISQAQAQGWNACLDEVARLNAEQPAPVAVALPVDPERERLMEIVQQYPNVDPLKYDAAVRTLRK